VALWGERLRPTKAIALNQQSNARKEKGRNKKTLREDGKAAAGKEKVEKARTAWADRRLPDTLEV